jgi:hypothetical protein
VARTVAATDATGNTAGFKQRFGDASVGTGAARQDRARCRADLSAVQVSANAMHQFAHHVFSQAGVCACRTDRGAVETRLDAFGKLGLIKSTQVLGIGLQHLHDTRHLDLLSVTRFSQPAVPGDSDLQGLGRTGDIDRPIDVQLMADDIAALIDRLRGRTGPISSAIPDCVRYAGSGVRISSGFPADVTLAELAGESAA